jgi:hypothetical protein
MTLPSNRNVILLAATLSDLSLGAEVNLAHFYNAHGIYTDGTTFPVDGGIDAGGAAYSGNLLGVTSPNGEEVTVGTTAFHIAGSNILNVVYGTGQTIPLPSGIYTDLKLLGTGVQGSQVDQVITVHYADGSNDTFHQSFSDWSSPSGYGNESLAIKTAYRDYNDGSRDSQAFNVYLYDLKLRPFKPVESITLPDNRNVVFLSSTLAPLSLIDLEQPICSTIGKPTPR